MDDKNPLKMKVSELKEALGRRGLSQTGLKFDLAQRLQSAMDVDEFGALPSLASPSQSSSSPLPVPAKDPADYSDSPLHSPQTPSCEFTQGGPPDEQAQDLEMATETETSEAAKPIEQSCVDPSKVSDATQSEGIAPTGTENILTLGEELACGKKGSDQNKASNDGSDDGSDNNMHAGIVGDERKVTVGSDPSEISNDVEKCGATANANEEAPLLSFSSSKADKNNSTKDCVQSEENTLLLLPDSADPASTPASSRKDTEQVEKEDTDQPGVGVEELERETTARNGVKPDDSDQKKVEEAKGDTADYDANQRNQETNNEGPSKSAPGSLLLSSLAERMKDREERFRQEKKPCNEKGEGGEVEDKIGNKHPRPSKGSDHDRGGKINSRCGGGESAEASSVLARDACPDVHGAQTVEDARRAKLMKRKERFMAAPFAGSGNGPSDQSGDSSLVKLGSPLAECPSGKGPSELLGEETSDELTTPRWKAASEAAAKMARRSERFGANESRPRVPREVSSAIVCDPRGTFLAELEDTSEANIGQSPLKSGGYSFDPLPQRRKRARATTTPPFKNDGTPAKRRGVGGGVAVALDDAISPNAVEARSNDGKAAKTTERGDLRLLLARSNGVDENPVRREGTGERSPPSSSAKRVSLASAFVLLGVKKPAPERSSANAAAGKGKGKPPPTPRLCRDGNEMDGASKHPPECPDKKGKTSRKKNQQRDGLLPGAAPSSQGTFRHPCRGEQAEKKIAEQAAKMAERRKRFAEDPRAPSFR